MNPRHAAYQALLASLRNESFIMPVLERWQQETSPSPRDFSLAYEIASGSARMALALDDIAKQLSSNKTLSMKLKEKALLRTAIYQHCFMSKIPDYAIVNETIEIAKQHCHQTFVSFLNALLRRLTTFTPIESKEDFIRYSYPKEFVKQLITNYGYEKTIDILKAGNIPSKVMARVCNTEKNVYEMITVTSDQIKEISTSSKYYIQNQTPVSLMKHLYQKQIEETLAPKNILDLCASPGGKLLLAHELFPEARLFGNDLSEAKLNRLKSNLDKYQVTATLSSGPGECYPNDQLFDLIILDVPCSNSGVLNKRPEARWRLSQEALKDLYIIQEALLNHAVKLLSPQGMIWYMTCSILKDENEYFLQKQQKKLQLEPLFTETILPNTLTGEDGGFAQLLKKKV